ncbi:BhlA/UviB family holin-like peptide [Halalkalibacterium halodurans]|uniref:BhlA holin family protein n=1 Tax=Halalkalibacterium halodurans TaxID=86665 RepID=A0A0M0KLI1_ALKHA|nr:BhlA/UviB family holin-like peptide [Halalkalibacterium halodurans]TPE65944.1 hypothetical protein AMD02_019755 [Halalkalibacterium halodurans]
MDYTVANEIATSQAVWAILCILLAAYFIREMKKENQIHREDSRKRENALIEHLHRSNESQEKTAETLEQIQLSLRSLEKRMDRVEQNMYVQRRS